MDPNLVFWYISIAAVIGLALAILAGFFIPAVVALMVKWWHWVLLAVVGLLVGAGLGFVAFKVFAPAPPDPVVVELQNQLKEQDELIKTQATQMAEMAARPTLPPAGPIPTLPSSVNATATPAVVLVTTCTNTAVVKSETPFDVNTNMDTGDGSAWVVTYGYDDTGSKFVSMIEPDWNLDFESTHIRGKYWLLDGDVNSVTCFALEKAASAGVTYMLYVGTADAPAGFTKEIPVRGWKMSTNQPFGEKKVDTGAAAWSDSMNRSKKEDAPIGEMTAVIYGQMWNGSDSSHVTHFVVEAEYQVTFTNLQGTYWLVSGGDSDEVQARFDQMTREVEIRDDHPTVTKVYCGETPPSGWSGSMPSGWTCERINP